MHEVCGKSDSKFWSGEAGPAFGVTGSVDGWTDGNVDGLLWKGDGMGKVGNASIEAKEQARTRRIEMEKDRQQRDDRIDEATAAVIVARAEIASARASADASNAAARENFEATVNATAQAEAATIAQQQASIDAAVRRLLAEKLTAHQVAQLTEMTPAAVRSIVRDAGRASGTNDSATALAGGAGAAVTSSAATMESST